MVRYFSYKEFFETGKTAPAVRLIVKDLKEKMLNEVAGIELVMLDGTNSKEEVWNSFKKMI